MEWIVELKSLLLWQMVTPGHQLRENFKQLMS
jgi:hypothetical protein